MSDPFKKVSPAALIALKEALAVIYWYKKDIRFFLPQGCAVLVLFKLVVGDRPSALRGSR